MEISEDISIGEKQELYSDVVSINNLFNENDRRTNTNLLQKVVFAMGHVLNDICASMWFTYIILYFEYVLKLGAIYASYVFLIGQITDAITTPIAGI
ncbi:hypothetical protein A3Q56_01321 [Intoshia linei]|uniref:Major facilitator superfamily associated domain-containing protein n=1 Tax=Intoshia linei TaxID=1819745 RepID=A0A177BC06_9BILA|nr:hypothetical protein A3Q56_01321 [Intoshia linei]